MKIKSVRRLFGRAQRGPDDETAPQSGAKRITETSTLSNLEALLKDVEGWCTLHKAEKLQELASSPSVRMAVEIGVFGGKSLLPMAAALKAKGYGCIYGIEPWDNDVAVETVTNEENDKWWKELDLVAIKRGFLQKLLAEKLEGQIKLLELASDSAIQVFQSARFYGKVDLLHIDGSHSFEQSVFDVSFWLRMCAKGAFIVLDDINWASVGVAFEFMKNAADMIYSVSDEQRGHFAVFRKR